MSLQTIAEQIEQSEREQDQRAEQAEAIAAKISDRLPTSFCGAYEKLFSAAVRVLEGEATIDEAVASLSSKKVIIKRK